MPIVKKLERPGVQGFLHEPAGIPRAALLLSHGAGSNCEAPLMVAAAAAFADIGWLTLRGDLAYRQQRRSGAPSSSGAKDREGILLAVQALRELAPGCPVYMGGQSYGGRMSTMLAAEDPAVAQ